MRNDSAMENAVFVQDGRKAVKERFEMILADECYRCSSVRQLKIESEHKWTER